MRLTGLRKLILNVVVLLVALSFLLLGCAIVLHWAPGRSSNRAFSHAKHAKELGLTCAVCHPGATQGADAGLPTMATCEACHGGQEQYEKYIQPFVEQGKLTWIRVTDIAEEVIFSHKLHQEKGLQCSECHRGIEQSNATSRKLKVSKDDCLDCHAKAGLSGDCALCHQKIDKSWEPSSHLANWTYYHGQMSRAGLRTPCEHRCDMCHSEAFCSSCHQDSPPRDHTNHFRRRGHGISASIDRQRCVVCHRTDFCTRCHEHVSPRTHTGSWASPRNRHCLQCHFPLSDQSCFVCHKDESSHRAEATPMPGDALHEMSPMEACLNCHTTDMPHPDTGEDCRRCHE